MTRDAHVPERRLQRITELPQDFGDIVRLSLGEEFGAMQRMREDWDPGANRFDCPGEVLLEARLGTRLVGICGLNRDPYAQSSAIGRVRHLYVDPECRRSGVGRALVSKIIEFASQSFSRLRLRTLRADADQFYVAIGFRRVVDDADATHEWEELSPAESA
jgi:GNAT superfamily N-acetyltransferase